MAEQLEPTFEALEGRMQEILELVSDEELPLDEALALYEEAAKLGMDACSLSERAIQASQGEEEAALEAADIESGEGAASAAASEEAAPDEAADAASTEAVG